MTAAQRIPLKDQLFTREKVELIASEIERAHPAFRADEFLTAVVARFPQLELKGRIDWIATCLEWHLPRDLRRAVGVLVRSLAAPADPNLSDGDFGDFIYAPYAEYVARHGCTAEDLDFSLAALREITTRFSAEFRIRPFLDLFPGQVLATLQVWTEDAHYHVRRLGSEGTRPRLPWALSLTLPHDVGIQLSTGSSRTLRATSRDPWPTTSTTSPRRTRSSRWTLLSGGGAQGCSTSARWAM